MPNKTFFAILNHFKLIFNVWDPIQEVPYFELIPKPKIPNLESKFNFQFQFLVPFLVFVAFYLNTFIVLALDNFHYDSQSELYFINRIYPREFWVMANTIIPVGVLMAFVPFGLLLFGAKLDENYKMFLVFDRETHTPIIYLNDPKGLIELNKAESFMIYSTRKRLLTAFRTFYWSSTLLTLGFFEFQTITRWKSTFRDVVTLIYLPSFVIYILSQILYQTTAFVLTVRYIRIKQERDLKKINSLINFLLLKSMNPKIHLNRKVYQTVWRRFSNFNQEILELGQEIVAHNRFWSPFLTISFAGYIMLICYIAYGTFFIRSKEVYAQIFFTNFTCQLSAFLLLIIEECSRLVNFNSIINDRHHKFMILFQKTFKTIEKQHLIKMDYIKWNRKNVPRIGFALVNGFRINSKMFEMIFSYISMLFMKIFGEQNQYEKYDKF